MGDIGNVGRLRMGGNDTETSQALGHLREIARKASISRSNSPATAFIVLPSAELLKSLVKPLANTVVSLWNYGFDIRRKREERYWQAAEREWHAAVLKAEQAQASRRAMSQRMENLEHNRKPIVKHHSITPPHTADLVNAEGYQETIATAGSVRSDDEADSARSKSAAGSIFSNEPVPPLSPSAAQFPPKFDTSRLSSPTPSRPISLIKPHPLSTCPHFTKLGVGENKTSNGSLACNTEDVLDDDIASASVKSTSPTTFRKIDFNTPDSNGMLLYGRWRHHKDAPLSHLKDMIDRDMRGNDSCSIFGAGMLKLEDHPVLPIYLARLEAESKREPESMPEPPLSPILMSGHDTCHRSFLRSSTPTSFTQTNTGTFKTTGFQMRTASMSSTIDSAIDMALDAEGSPPKGASNTGSPTPTITITPPSPAIYNDTYNPMETAMTKHFLHPLIPVKGVYYPQPAIVQAYSEDADEDDIAIFPPPYTSRQYINEYCGGVATKYRPDEFRPKQARKVTHVSAKDAENPFWDSDEEDNGSAESEDLCSTRLGVKMPIRPLPPIVMVRKPRRARRGPAVQQKQEQKGIQLNSCLSTSELIRQMELRDGC